MGLDKPEAVNIKRGIDECFVSIPGHYYHVGAYAAKHTPFFAG
jgi:hypothetical protein